MPGSCPCSVRSHLALDPKASPPPSCESPLDFGGTCSAQGPEARGERLPGSTGWRGGFLPRKAAGSPSWPDTPWRRRCSCLLAEKGRWRGRGCWLAGCWALLPGFTAGQGRGAGVFASSAPHSRAFVVLAKRSLPQGKGIGEEEEEGEETEPEPAPPLSSQPSPRAARQAGWCWVAGVGGCCCWKGAGGGGDSGSHDVAVLCASPPPRRRATAHVVSPEQIASTINNNNLQGKLVVRYNRLGCALRGSGSLS